LNKNNITAVPLFSSRCSSNLKSGITKTKYGRKNERKEEKKHLLLLLLLFLTSYDPLKETLLSGRASVFR
jgi:hypothetical protein